MFLKDHVAAPLYRLPTMAYERSLPGLLADGAVDEHDMQTLLAFFSEVETLNRGLDLAQKARESGDQVAVVQELQRNQVKARRLTAPESGTNYYTEVRDAISRHLA